ncbi:30S ribosomal protein S1 [Gemmatimonadota bacterium]
MPEENTLTPNPAVESNIDEEHMYLTEEELEASEYTEEEYETMMALYDQTLALIDEGQIVSGVVLSIEDRDVIVDVGFKSEGIIPVDEFGDPSAVSVGDKVEVFLENIENQDGQIVLSKSKADFMKVWHKIKDAYDNGEVVIGRPSRRIKGGLMVDLMGVSAFLPGSQVALRQVRDFDQFIDRDIRVLIIKINKNRRNIVVSRRMVLEAERARMRTEVLSNLVKGQIREGTVKNITDFGAFIDLGGVDGLLHITDMSWGRVAHPSEVVNISDVVQVKVLDYNEARDRISLGLKQLQPYPWRGVEDRYPMNAKVMGKVVSITDYGAFVELEEGIEGLVHISEMSWTQHIRHPSKLVNIGDDIEVVVLRVNAEDEKISLGLKQTEPDPWETLEVRFPISSKLDGKVRNLTNFGAFVEIEPGIDGLVHISDMSWTKRIRHPSEILQKGQEIDVVVLGIDREQRRISLGFKQAQPNPWDDLAATYEPGTETTGKITRFIEKGVIVDIPDDVEGFVPLQQLGRDDLSTPEEAFDEGDELPLTVIEFDREGRKIVLSVTEYFKSKDQNEQDAFVKKHEKREITLGDHEGADGLADLKEQLEFAEKDSPESESAEEPVEEAGAEPETVEEPAEEPDAEPETAEEPAEEPDAEPETVEEPAEEPDAEPETAEEPAEEPDAEPETVEEPAEEPEAEPETVEEPAEEPAPEAEKETDSGKKKAKAKKTAKKKSAKKPVKKSDD